MYRGLTLDTGGFVTRMSTKINGRIKENSIRRLVRIVNSVRNKFESSFEILKYFSTILTVRLTRRGMRLKNLQKERNRSFRQKKYSSRRYAFATRSVARFHAGRETQSRLQAWWRGRDSPIKGLGSIITPSLVKQPAARHVIRLSSLHSISPRIEGEGGSHRRKFR